jgi:hypothetical protein
MRASRAHLSGAQPAPCDYVLSVLIAPHLHFHAIDGHSRTNFWKLAQFPLFNYLRVEMRVPHEACELGLSDWQIKTSRPVMTRLKGDFGSTM